MAAVDAAGYKLEVFWERELSIIVLRKKTSWRRCPGVSALLSGCLDTRALPFWDEPRLIAAKPG